MGVASGLLVTGIIASLFVIETSPRRAKASAGLAVSGQALPE
jgi:hypothetical protein